MSGRVLTPEQEAAVAASSRDLLVEAGAGTGKTSVMVERYCRLVCEGGASPDEVLAFTFTDRAAAELRQRIRAALELRAAAGSDRARELVAGFGGAWVTTIHGFCNRLLGAHPVAAGIDPRFRVLDAPESERIAGEAFDEALEEFLGDGDPPRETTLAAFRLEGLRSIVLAPYAELRSRGHRRPSLPEPPPVDAAGALREAAEAAAEALDGMSDGGRHRDVLERAVELLAAAGDGAGPPLDDLVELRTTSRAKEMAAYKEAMEAAVCRSAEAGEGGLAYGHVAELLRLFGRRYEAAKARRSGIDFEDLQLLAVDLLGGAVGDSYRGRFSHILVDEFQDTNRLQLRLIEALRGPRTSVMAVGDELQSIYGFRHADLDVFRERRTEVERGPDGGSLRLSGNFRARPEVIGAVNEIGRGLFGDAYRPLRVGAPPAGPEPPGAGPPVELLLTARDGWEEPEIDLQPATDASTPPRTLAEARFLASRLRELVDGGVERGSVVVLLRAFTHLDAFEDSLERAGLRPYTVGGRGYWSHQQVGDVCALLATLANPLDDQSLFGALASPACGAAPDTLWLLRRAAGGGRHVWPALELLAGLDDPELSAPERLEQIPPAEVELLREFAARVASLRSRGPRLPLAELVDAVVTETGYDLAVLSRPTGEARFANVRKLIRLAAEYEAREGRDLRGLLDFLAARADADADAAAATAVEGHDGVRIMTVHAAKGLEFDVVAVPQLGRDLVVGGMAPLVLGRGEEPRVGMQLRRLGAASLNLFSYSELCEEARGREAEEELRLFHVAATRARERLILSGVVSPTPVAELRESTPVLERVAQALGTDRESDSTVAVPAPDPREGLEAAFAPSEIAVRVSAPSPERAAELTERVPGPEDALGLGEGAAPLVARRPPVVPRRPLSYTAIEAYGECAYRFYMERVLGLAERIAPGPADGGEGPERNGSSRRDRAAARGAAVHSLLEWSAANGWAAPPAEVVRGHAVAAGLDGSADLAGLAGAVEAWLDSELLRERVSRPAAAVRSEVPLLLGLAGTVLRGSIDLLVEEDGRPPLVLDYKTDRLGGALPAERAGHYEVQRTIYALAVAEARGASEVEVAYVFLERPDEPVLSLVDAEQMSRGRARIEREVERIGSGEFPPAPVEARSWDLCRGCPALGRLCSGPERSAGLAAGAEADPGQQRRAEAGDGAG